MKRVSSSRAVAAKAIFAIVNGRSIADLSWEAKQEKAWIQAVVYGVCRFHPRLQFLLSLLLKKPFKAKDQDIEALLLVGLYQLMDMNLPPHAAVSKTVETLAEWGKEWAKGVVNAVLRRYLREKELLDKAIEKNEVAYYAHPAWYIERIKAMWPEDWQAILLANNEHPPFSLRINARVTRRDAYLEKLQTLGLNATPIDEAPHGLILTTPMEVAELPGFVEGEVSIQDGAAQWVMPWIQIKEGMRILDACAAPGGKLLHLLENLPADCTVMAIEKDPVRMQKIKENMQRLKLTAECLVADAGDTTSWWQGELFDRILLDVPCSGSGVLRRHPDIKLLRKSEDSANFVRIQQQLLTSLWHVLKPSGLLMYVTCSIFKEENSDLIASFLKATPSAVEEKIIAKRGLPQAVGLQVLPGMYGMDGFYYAVLRKCVE